MTTQGIDFANLSLRDALDLATLIEEEAHDRYLELAEQMRVYKTVGAEAFFRKMARVEERHRSQLAVRRAELFADERSTVTRAQLFDVEAPEYDDVRYGMTPKSALNVALHCEEKAHAFFEAALPQVRDLEVKALFSELCAEEVEHQNWVRAELARLPDQVEPDADVADDPVAH